MAKVKEQGFVLISMLILITLMSAIVVGIMDRIHLQSNLQAHLIRRWQMQQALNWSMGKLQHHLPANIPDRCDKHLCTEKDLADQPDWHSITLPTAFQPIQSTYIASRFQVNAHIVTQVLVKVNDRGKLAYRFGVVSR